ncbi:hypothetical protein BSKO_06874 [Bryopsis sp. KO-2023]|nr:hypothetical protein BSKO_06874 [Bryopsis sp. KO-2023]
MATSDGGALALLGNETICHFETTHFESNIAQNRGGAIFSKDIDRLHISSSTFGGNSCGVSDGVVQSEDAGHGGAIFLVSSTSQIVNSSFTNNSALFGGALAVRPTIMSILLKKILPDEVLNETSIEKCVFLGNRAKQSGGAIAMAEDVPVKLVDADFELNVADVGGALSVSGADARMERGSCIRNHARENGGAIWIGGPKSKAKISDWIFTSNNSTVGGAIFLEGNANSTISGCTFSTNQAQLGGGAVYAQQGELNLIGEDTEGVLHITMTDSKFSENRAGELIRVIFWRNSASWGGGVAIMTVKESEMKSRMGIEFSDVQFLRNTVSKGGAGLEVRGVELHCRSCVFRQNRAGDAEKGGPGDGGGILATSGTLLTLEKSTVRECSAAKSGGGVYMRDAAAKGITLALSNNVAGENGGGMAAHFSSSFTPRGDMRLVWNCTFCSIDDNKSKIGGGLHILTDPGSKQACEALSNVSSSESQEEFFQLLEDCRPTGASSEFLANQGENLGHNLFMSDTAFEGNIADVFGSGLVSGVADNNSFFATECAFDTSALPRSIKTTILLVFLPGVVWAAYSMLYLKSSRKKNNPFEYIKFHSITALLAVLSAAYIG